MTFIRSKIKLVNSFYLRNWYWCRLCALFRKSK